MQNNTIVLSGAGFWCPEQIINNDELVASYNDYINELGFNMDSISDKAHYSSASFIEKASGIMSRNVIDKEGILDTGRMIPRLDVRRDDELSIQGEMAVKAARRALDDAGKDPGDVDAVIVSCTYLERPYPAIAVEVQHELGIQGFAFDMSVACSSATFGLHRAYDMIRAGTAKSVLVVTPEIMTPQVDFRDRTSHFILGDAAAAAVVEIRTGCKSPKCFEILGCRAKTVFSNSVRSNFGFLGRTQDVDPYAPDRLFHQDGHKVFKEVSLMVVDFLSRHLEDLGLENNRIRRWWLHQANSKMNGLIARRILGRDATQEEAPLVLGQYGNVAAAGCLVAFYLNHKDMNRGDIGVLCSFGAGYSMGSLVLKKI